ncbi:MAG: sugar transferase, partial [Bacteroidia bacterium]|nr:sugar transferase [Bacteroidia bacterium]
RLFDIICSLLGILVLSPVFIIIWICVRLESKGPALFLQTRVGLNEKDFRLFKFRTMYLNAEAKGQLTVGMKDPRITGVGYFLRKYKLDELPQLFNVLKGDMSLVGPRPEVKKYVNLYTKEQKIVLSVRPGITDYASIAFINENELLAKAENPEKYYIEHIMQEKLALNLSYINSRLLFKDVILIWKTLIKIVF